METPIARCSSGPSCKISLDIRRARFELSVIQFLFFNKESERYDSIQEAQNKDTTARQKRGVTGEGFFLRPVSRIIHYFKSGFISLKWRGAGAGLF